VLSVTAVLPDGSTDLPPIVLIHGAANASAVWLYWQRALAAAGWPSYALDLRGHGNSTAIDLSQTRMADYAADAQTVLDQLNRPVVVMGWSMGGLVALMAATAGSVCACVGLAPSTPAQAVDAAVVRRTGEFGPEEYGITSENPDNQPAMPDLDLEERRVALSSLGRESQLARDERKAGVVVASLPCPLLIVAGGKDTQWPRSRYNNLWLPVEHLEAPLASHWGLVLSRQTVVDLAPRVVAWLVGALGKGA